MKPSTLLLILAGLYLYSKHSQQYIPQGPPLPTGYPIGGCPPGSTWDSNEQACMAPVGGYGSVGPITVDGWTITSEQRY